MLKLPALFVGLIGIFGHVVFAGERPFVEPDWLHPVHPYPHESRAPYCEAVRTELKLRTHYHALMVVRPPFDGEYAVRLHSENGLGVEWSTKMFLTYTVADSSIWVSRSEPDEGEPPRPKVTVATTTLEIPKPLGMRLIAAWEQMLRRTHYEGGGAAARDATAYEFGTPWLYGETSLARVKSPKLMVELGESLVAYCKVEEKARPGALKEIEAKATALETYLAKHPLQISTPKPKPPAPAGRSSPRRAK